MSVALELFARRGYRATTMDDIAEAAGVTKPLVYQHFSSKRALYLELVNSIAQELLSAVKSAVLQAQGPRQQVEMGFAAYFRLVISREAEFRLLYGRDHADDKELGLALRTVEDARAMLRAGADKVSLNTAAVEDPDLIARCADAFGSQAVVAAVDAKRMDDAWRVFTYGGRRDTGLDAVDYARVAAARGAGEILLTSMDRDGAMNGFDLKLLKAVSTAVDIPVIASGGAGNATHLVEAVKEGGADAVLAASIFHFGELSISEAKRAMAAAGVSVRQS